MGTDATLQNNRIAIVVQRYGNDIVGGAEAHARIIAGKLQDDLGYVVEVYTTTAKDYMTWENYYLPGVESIDNVQVRRFTVARPRARFFGFHDRVIRKLLSYFNRLKLLDPLSKTLEWAWVYLQGPVCPDLVRSLRDNQLRYKKIIFFCYLYYPTLKGSKGLEDRAILIPLAHDEPPFHFKIVRDLLRRMPRMIPNTEPEWDMIKGKLDESAIPYATPAGLGFDFSNKPPSTPISAQISNSINQGRYILYLGRISAGKGVKDLLNWFRDWQVSNSSSSVRLLLAGQKESSIELSQFSGVEYLGFVTDDERDQLIRGALCVVNPSIYESLSMIVIEAIAQGKPVLVRRQCEVFRYYSTKAPSVILFEDSEQFSAGLDRVLSTQIVSAKIAISKAWAEDRFSWPRILDVFKAQIEHGQVND